MSLFGLRVRGKDKKLVRFFAMEDIESATIRKLPNNETVLELDYLRINEDENHHENAEKTASGRVLFSTDQAKALVKDLETYRMKYEKYLQKLLSYFYFLFFTYLFIFEL